jgi:glycosyltransferase involved in cell wall biosynthesis
MRMLALTRYGRLGASSRLRTFQYVPAFESAGIRVHVSPLLDDRYVDALYAGRRAAGAVFSGYVRRVSKLLAARRFDAVWVEKECLPWLPAWLEFGLLPRSCKLIADYDDALFHRYDQHRSALVRQLLGSKIDAVMRRASVVTAGSSYLAQRARDAGARRVEIIPTVVDLTRYPLEARRVTDDAECVIGWIGSPNTFSFLAPAMSALRTVATRPGVRCVAIGARKDQVAGTPFEAVAWTEPTEAAQLRRIDIGIMPLPDEPWHRGKCGYKLIQYMACGLPVVASPVGVNTEIVTPGENGELAASQEQWVAALEHLILNAELRRRMGAAGRKRVEWWYSLECQAPRLVGMLQALVAKKA